MANQGALGNQLERLLRAEWPNVNMFAEEVYAVLSQLQIPEQVAGTAASEDGSGRTSRPVATATGGIPCKIISGSGFTYKCDVYENGLAGAKKRVSVVQLQIAEGDTIPEGTWTLASKDVQGKYTMQVPVWM